MSKPPDQSTNFCVGPWLDSDAAAFATWLAANEHNAPGILHPAVADFKRALDADAGMALLAQQMFDQVPHEPPFDKDPYGAPQTRLLACALRLISRVLTQAPPFNQTKLVGLPINAILDWSIGTPAGFAAFHSPAFNVHIKAILTAWGRFLQSPASRHTLTDDARSGWFGADARAAMPTFAQDFICEPDQPYHGFASWDVFFTREFRPGRRPLPAIDDDDVIVNACESAPYRLERGVKRDARFWIKAQPYSLAHMLNNDTLLDRFVGGTVYQAFLSAFSYHRWHSPVNGTIVKTCVIDGSYYAQNPEQEFDESAPRLSQAYITQVATRALIFIEADNPAIGLMCVMPVGMAEISTCDITVQPGQRVRKGDQLGMFHFGGSTHCLIFGPEVSLDFDLRGQLPSVDATPIPLHAALARVHRAPATPTKDLS